MESAQEKTEKPTARRRNQAKQKGNIAESREVNSAAVLLASVFGFYSLGVYLHFMVTKIWTRLFTSVRHFRIGEDNCYWFFRTCTTDVIMTVAPMILFITIAGLVACLAQTKLNFTWQPLKPKLEKINPLKGVKKLFGVRSAAEFLKSLFKLIIVGYTAYHVVSREYPNVIQLLQLDVSQIIHYVSKVMLKLLLITTMVIIVLAAIDYIFQRHQHEKGMKMTKQEVKDERKQNEGDPKIKARVRGVQVELARRRMISETKEADVVITNPTHLAVALKYKRGETTAPVVVAKGAGALAERMRQIARTRGIPIVQKRLLARMLFKLVDVGQEIPETLYRAVAEILAYVYKLKGMRGAADAG